MSKGRFLFGDDEEGPCFDVYCFFCVTRKSVIEQENE